MAEPSDTAPAYRPRCMFLCCKSMMVFGENFAQDPEYDPDGAYFWCNHTGRGQGPDDGPVSMGECTTAERGCFKEY